VRELVIAGGPTHLQTFDVPDQCDAIMVAEPVPLSFEQIETLTCVDYATRCPVKRYASTMGTIKIIEHPSATHVQIADACDKAVRLHLGWVPIL